MPVARSFLDVVLGQGDIFISPFLFREGGGLCAAVLLEKASEPRPVGQLQREGFQGDLLREIAEEIRHEAIMIRSDNLRSLDVLIDALQVARGALASAV